MQGTSKKIKYEQKKYCDFRTVVIRFERIRSNQIKSGVQILSLYAKTLLLHLTAVSDNFLYR